MQDYSINFYFRQAWRDPRLEFEPLGGTQTQIKMGDGRWDEIWVPDTFFRNEKKAGFHEVTVPNRLLKLNATGHVWYVTKCVSLHACTPVCYITSDTNLSTHDHKLTVLFLSGNDLFMKNHLSGWKKNMSCKS